MTGDAKEHVTDAEKGVIIERTRMALAEAGYPNAEVEWSAWMRGPAVYTWRASTGPLVPGEVATRACDLAMQTAAHIGRPGGPDV